MYNSELISDWLNSLCVKTLSSLPYLNPVEFCCINVLFFLLNECHLVFCYLMQWHSYMS